MNALTVKELGVNHRRRPVLRGVNLQVPRGSITALLGQNGSGKSTLMRSVLGLHPRLQGTVQILDLPQNTAPAKLRQQATYVPTGGAVLPGETGRTHFAFGARLFPQWQPDRALQAAQEFHVPLDQRAGLMSTGQRMGLALAYALGSNAQFLLLDEPTNGLDPEHRVLLAQLLAAYAASGGSILLSSHVLPEIEGLADRGAFLKGGQIILEADLDELRAQHLTLQAILPDVLPAGELEQLRLVPGVQTLRVEGRTLIIELHGPREPLLHALTALRPLDMQFRPRPLADAYAALLGDAA